MRFLATEVVAGRALPPGTSRAAWLLDAPYRIISRAAVAPPLSWGTVADAAGPDAVNRRDAGTRDLELPDRVRHTGGMSWLSDEDDFPPVSFATEDGLLMLGGRLTAPRVLEAYRRGIFPWPITDRGLEILAWFSPDPRDHRAGRHPCVAPSGAADPQWAVSGDL